MNIEEQTLNQINKTLELVNKVSNKTTIVYLKGLFSLKCDYENIKDFNKACYYSDVIIDLLKHNKITYNDETGYDYKAHLTILDSNGEEIINTEVPEYKVFVDVEFIKGKIIILTLKTYDDSSLLVYDTTGKLEEEIAIEDYYNETSMQANKLIKLNNQLVVHSKQEVKWQYRYQTFAFYNYDLSIYTLENLYGTLEVAQNAKAGDVVELKIVPNSGYEVSEITIIDNLGNQILVSENKFTMPDEDVYITVKFSEEVTISSGVTVTAIGTKLYESGDATFTFTCEAVTLATSTRCKYTVGDDNIYNLRVTAIGDITKIVDKGNKELLEMKDLNMMSN